MTHPADLLIDAMRTRNSPACVGLDPVLQRLPEPIRSSGDDRIGQIRAFCLGVLEAVSDLVGVVKPQSACFERFGSLGYRVLEEVIARARELGLVVILDAKRGDIGSSAEHYASGARSMGADWITVSPYMGPSTIEPFLDAGLGVFALCRTSNPDSGRLQSLQIQGRSLAEHTAEMLSEMARGRIGKAGWSSVGAVVGATRSTSETARLRELMPDMPLLVPGLGAQGGTVRDISPMCQQGDAGSLGVVVNASRSVLYPESGIAGCWQDAVRQAAQDLVDQLRLLGCSGGEQQRP